MFASRISSVGIAACMLLLASVPAAAASGPTVSLQPLNSPLEGAPGTTASITYNVRLSAPSAVPVTVEYASENGFATGCLVRSAGCDFLHTSGRLTFQPGETLKSVIITVFGDSTAEDHETLSVLLSNPVNATVPLPRAIAAILNDDAPLVTVRAEPSPVEGADGQFNAVVYRLSLSGRYIATVAVDVATEDGTAWGCLGSGLGCDYQQVRGTVTFIPGEVQKTIAVPIYGDNQSEADETLALLLSNPVDSVISTPRVGSTIRNDD